MLFNTHKPRDVQKKYSNGYYSNTNVIKDKIEIKVKKNKSFSFLLQICYTQKHIYHQGKLVSIDRC